MKKQRIVGLQLYDVLAKAEKAREMAETRQGTPGLREMTTGWSVGTA